MTAFAKASEAHDLTWMQLTPCAGALHRWLLRNRPAGREQDIELEDFRILTGQGRPRPYCMRHIKDAFNELVDANLVEVVRRYSGRVFKVIARHPGDKKETSQDVKESSKTHPSKPHSHVLYNREIQRTTNKTIVPEKLAKEDDLPVSDGQPEPLNSGEQETSKRSEACMHLEATSKASGVSGEQKELLEEARRTVSSMSPALQKAVLGASVSVVRNAIEALKEQQQTPGKIKNSAGWLMKAIQGKWTTNKAGSLATKEFREWVDLARKVGIVRASEYHPERGRIVLTCDDIWVPFEAIKREWPMVRLKQRVDSSPIVFSSSVAVEEQHDNTPEWLELALAQGVISRFREDKDGIWVEDPQENRWRPIGPMRMNYSIERLRGGT